MFSDVLGNLKGESTGENASVVVIVTADTTMAIEWNAFIVWLEL